MDCENMLETAYEECDSLREEIATLKAELEVAVAALEWYTAAYNGAKKILASYRGEK